MPERDHASQFYLVSFSNPSGGKYSMVQGLSTCFTSKLFKGILWSFPSNSRLPVSPLPSAKLFDDYPLGEALVTWPNKYHLFKRVISPEKHWLELYLLVKLQFLFLIRYHFFFKCIKTPNEKCTFPTTTNILDLYFYCVIFSFSLFQRLYL